MSGFHAPFSSRHCVYGIRGRRSVAGPGSPSGNARPSAAGDTYVAIAETSQKPSHASKVTGQVRDNLEAIASRFEWVLSSTRLRDDATADNLQWLTHLQEPRCFLQALEREMLSAPLPASGPGRPG